MTLYPEKEKELHVCQYGTFSDHYDDQDPPSWRITYLENGNRCSFFCATLREALSYTQRWMSTKGYTITRIATDARSEPFILLPDQDADAIALIFTLE